MPAAHPGLSATSPREAVEARFGTRPTLLTGAIEAEMATRRQFVVCSLSERRTFSRPLTYPRTFSCRPIGGHRSPNFRTRYVRKGDYGIGCSVVPLVAFRVQPDRPRAPRRMVVRRAGAPVGPLPAGSRQRAASSGAASAAAPADVFCIHLWKAVGTSPLWRAFLAGGGELAALPRAVPSDVATAGRCAVWGGRRAAVELAAEPPPREVGGAGAGDGG